MLIRRGCVSIPPVVSEINDQGTSTAHKVAHQLWENNLKANNNIRRVFLEPNDIVRGSGTESPHVLRYSFDKCKDVLPRDILSERNQVNLIVAPHFFPFSAEEVGTVEVLGL